MMEQKITEVVAALIVKDHRFLICQRPAHKARGLLWEFVGGKVEPGETLPQALIRECGKNWASGSPRRKFSCSWCTSTLTSPSA